MASSKLMAVNKVQNGTKITQSGVLHSTKKPSFINWLDETAKTAKPLCVGLMKFERFPLFNSLLKTILSTHKGFKLAIV
jgi:hypothetical protein